MKLRHAYLYERAQGKETQNIAKQISWESPEEVARREREDAEEAAELEAERQVKMKELASMTDVSLEDLTQVHTQYIMALDCGAL